MFAPAVNVPPKSTILPVMVSFTGALTLPVFTVNFFIVKVSVAPPVFNVVPFALMSLNV